MSWKRRKGLAAANPTYTETVIRAWPHTEIPPRSQSRFVVFFSTMAARTQGPLKVVEGQGEKNGPPVEEKQRPGPAACRARLNLVPGSELLEARY